MTNSQWKHLVEGIIERRKVMIDVNEFLQTYYDINEQKMLTLEAFEDLKKENGIKAIPVRFWNVYGDYDYRFCEIGRRAI